MATKLQPAAQAADASADAEWQARVDLAAAYRLVALYGWDDLIFTHLSARVPGPEHHFLINPYTHMFEEITASSLVKIDVEGNQVDGAPAPVNRAGFVIHSAVHMARPDAAAVLHLHTPHGQAVSAMRDGLLPHTQTAMIAHHDVAYHDFEGIATNLEERQRIVADLGTSNSMLLRNHGTLALGASIPQAFMRMYFLERACEAQIMMLAAGREGLNDPVDGVAQIVREQTSGGDMATAIERLAWPALLRKLDRIDPGFRN